ncbi:MAG: hypothetical protein FRX49_13242 [Trebouxia sp. A1-2]|nr:MAG: hypothetical protein FRX49_13242 [Trebouxia sp. A1-2]
MLRQSIIKGLGRHGQAASESHTVQSVIRSFHTNTTLAAKHVSADHKKVSTPDEGDIGRGTHEPAPVEAGDPSDVVPNLVMPDEKSGKAFQQAQDLLISLLCVLQCWTQALAAVAYLLSGCSADVGKVPKGVEEVKGFKSGSGSTPELATQTTAKPGQEREEVATSPTPGLAPTKNMAPNKSIGSSWRPVSAFKQSRYMHTMSPAYKEDLGDREE